MYETVISFINAASRLPGCSGLLSLREALEQWRYRRNASKLKINAQINKFKKARAAGKELLRTAKERLPAPERSTAQAAPATAAVTGAGSSGTVIMPRPGGRASGTVVRAPAAPIPTMPHTIAVRGSGVNPLVDAGSELFILVGRLRSTAAHADVFQLRQDIAQKIVDFETTVRAAGIAHEHVIAARYALCTLLDESVLSTPWGADSQWARHSLLSQFHNETWGGEKFFLMVDRIGGDAAHHLALLEFLYVCMALGLEGKYRVIDDGRNRLSQIRERTYGAIRLARGDFERELSPSWKGVDMPAHRLSQRVPLWVAAAMTGTLLLAAYLGFSWNLARTSDPVRMQLARIGQDAHRVISVAPIVRTETLREALSEDIRAGRVDVVEQARGSTITLHGDGLFASGSAQVDPRLVPLLQRIATALNRFPGPVRISGHTDNQALSAALRVRYPSNWDLSQARADSVRTVLGAQLSEPGRLSAEGRGDSEPQAPNDTPEDRARNRRVEITLLGSDIRSADASAANATDRAHAPFPQTRREKQS